MKYNVPLFLIVLLSFNINSYAQVPFTTSMKEKYKYFIKADPSGEYGMNFLRGATLAEDSTGDNTKAIKLDTTGAVFFKNNAITQDFIGDQGVARVSTNLIFYKLYVYSSKEDNKRYALPFFLISRLSSKYDSSNFSTAADALDYEGSPVTLRFMPSGKKNIGDANTLYYGLIADYRGLNVVTDAGDYSYEHGFYCAAGFTYGGNGTATNLGSGETQTGIWTFSLMIESFWTKPKVMKELYDTDEDYATSIQGLFNFFISKDNPLNIKAGFQYYLTDPANAENFAIKLSLGSF